MKRLVALQQIPGSVVTINVGQQFLEPNPEQEAYWLKHGFARLAEPDAIKRSRRGWDGLLWDDAEVCIMASGPSITQEQVDAALTWAVLAPNRKTIAINTTYRLAPYASVLYACDARWWRQHIEDVREFSKSQLWSQDADALNISRQINLIKSDRKAGLGKTPGLIHQGMSSGYQAINMAYQAGAKRLLLLGFDCRSEGKLTHWHGDHPQSLNSTQPYKRWIDNMDQLAEDLASEGVEVLNLSPKSALQCFTKADWREVLV